MQSSSQAGESSSTQPLMLDSGQPGDAWTARHEDAGFEETRRSHLLARRTERGLGATPILAVIQAGRCGIRGNLKTPSEGGEDGARIGGNSSTHRQPSLKVQDSRKLEDPIGRRGRRARIGGNPNTHRRPSWKVQDSRELEDPIGRRGGRSADWGQPRYAPSAKLEGAGFEETRSLI